MKTTKTRTKAIFFRVILAAVFLVALTFIGTTSQAAVFNGHDFTAVGQGMAGSNQRITQLTDTHISPLPIAANAENTKLILPMMKVNTQGEAMNQQFTAITKANSTLEVTTLDSGIFKAIILTKHAGANIGLNSDMANMVKNTRGAMANLQTNVKANTAHLGAVIPGEMANAAPVGTDNLHGMAKLVIIKLDSGAYAAIFQRNSGGLSLVT